MSTDEEQMAKVQSMDWRAFTPDDSPMTPMDVMADPRHQALSTPDLREGDPAFGFSLPLYDFSTGVESATGADFDLLAAAREKPVALIFGSYT